MNSTRVIYVENDSALRQFLQESLKDQPGIELIGAYADGISALDRSVAKKADVALIDFGLDTDGLNGIELGIALREINEYIGIVIYSQFNVRKMVNRVPPAMRNGWSFFEKSGEMASADYAKILKDTAVGKGNWEEFFPAASDASDADLNPYYELTSRQRSIISLLAQGISVQEISVRLDLTYAYVRKELSRAYDILLPDAKESDDLKTLAILKYLQLVKTI
jgi:DNA-binding NarL/FixJ family response regulator